MCREQVVQSPLDSAQITSHIQQINRMLQQHQLQNRIRQQEEERQERLRRLAEVPMEDQDRVRLIEIYSGDNKITKGKQTKKELLLVLSLQYDRYTPPDENTSLKFVRAC